MDCRDPSRILLCAAASVYALIGFLLSALSTLLSSFLPLPSPLPSTEADTGVLLRHHTSTGKDAERRSEASSSSRSAGSSRSTFSAESAPMPVTPMQPLRITLPATTEFISSDEFSVLHLTFGEKTHDHDRDLSSPGASTSAAVSPHPLIAELPAKSPSLRSRICPRRKSFPARSASSSHLPPPLSPPLSAPPSHARTFFPISQARKKLHRAPSLPTSLFHKAASSGRKPKKPKATPTPKVTPRTEPYGYPYYFPSPGSPAAVGYTARKTPIRNQTLPPAVAL